MQVRYAHNLPIRGGPHSDPNPSIPKLIWQRCSRILQDAKEIEDFIAQKMWRLVWLPRFLAWFVVAAECIASYWECVGPAFNSRDAIRSLFWEGNKPFDRSKVSCPDWNKRF